jgi:ABC-type transport system involved in multi-copper enzyme maturation permease subunit
MIFLPIVTRELRVASRRRSTYWVRTSAALAVILAGTWLFLMMQDQPQGMVAMTLFCILTGSAVLYALLSGVRATADCLSEEKREGTLGLLFLTDLRGYDVVFGKLAANSLNAFYAVVAAMPMLAIPLLLGGVTPAEFGRMALVTLNTLFFSLAIGLSVSAMSRSAQKARATTMLLVVLFAVLLPATGGLLAAFNRTSQHVSLFFLLPSPGFAYYNALDFAYKLGGKPFWSSVGLVHGLAWLSLGVASVVAPRSWQDKPPGAQSLRFRERLRLWAYGNMAERAAFRRRLLNRNAFLWLAGRMRLKQAAVWGALFLVACLWVWGLAKFRRDWLQLATYFSTGLVLNLLLRCWFAGEASRQLAQERRAGTLELLLSTPLSVKEILHGQWLALKRQFLAPVLLVIGVECVLMFATASETLEPEERTAYIGVWVGMLVFLVADLAALYWVAMWQSLSARNPVHAANRSLIRILILPWVAYALVMVMVAIDSIGSRPSEPGWKFYMGLWLFLGLAADVGFALHARYKLLTEFRLAAQERFVLRAGLWARLRGTPKPGAPAVQPAIPVSR